MSQGPVCPPCPNTHLYSSARTSKATRCALSNAGLKLCPLHPTINVNLRECQTPARSSIHNTDKTGEHAAIIRMRAFFAVSSRRGRATSVSTTRTRDGTGTAIWSVNSLLQIPPSPRGKEQLGGAVPTPPYHRRWVQNPLS